MLTHPWPQMLTDPWSHAYRPMVTNAYTSLVTNAYRPLVTIAYTPLVLPYRANVWWVKCLPTLFTKFCFNNGMTSHIETWTHTCKWQPCLYWSVINHLIKIICHILMNCLIPLGRCHLQLQLIDTMLSLRLCFPA